ncbi:MAG TPA: class I SAM-dependent methyltransferase, partial [Burkholderiales bacterium]|nr:class I SAM-dependent methyltransferase [Burkholderiales bacterium]
MNEKDFDCYQRYTALKNLMDAAFPEATTGAPATVLDVGSGMSTLSRDFLGDRFRVARSDVIVDAAAGTDIVTLQPGQPLPFEPRAFDAVIAMDVLEHVRPAERELFVSECVRVATDVCILAAPVASPAIEEAEARVYRVHQARLGSHAYFEEHTLYGLPAAREVEQWIRATGAALVTLPNVPLVAWETFSSLDFIGYSKPDTVDLTMDAH